MKNEDIEFLEVAFDVDEFLDALIRIRVTHQGGVVTAHGVPNDGESAEMEACHLIDGV